MTITSLKNHTLLWWIHTSWLKETRQQQAGMLPDPGKMTCLLCVRVHVCVQAYVDAYERKRNDSNCLKCLPLLPFSGGEPSFLLPNSDHSERNIWIPSNFPSSYLITSLPLFHSYRLKLATKEHSCKSCKKICCFQTGLTLSPPVPSQTFLISLKMWIFICHSHLSQHFFFETGVSNNVSWVH